MAEAEATRGGIPAADVSVMALWSEGAEPRRAALTVLHHAREDGWHTELVEQTVTALAEKAHQNRRAWAAEHVDKGRQVAAAMQRAEDCVQHGADLRYERHSAYWCWTLAQVRDEERRVWIGACDALATLLAQHDPHRADQVRVSARRDVQRVRARSAAPSRADCPAAGRCEHPPVPAHGACQQLALFEVPGSPQPAPAGGQEPDHAA